ncbi:hypothetical protein AO935_32405 [Pseudomonas aeruginosa]|uniref:hypothetical protein n=1 Tax=Pseudomonas aeruginosa TaxID=287 RepID=UPI0008FB5B28|nr:hypothetical protein [Pseudomonas aeruginosa]OPD80961.1 hypothetical protein AO935_32405 [Pseudomonas aeruginosa]
MKTLGFSDDFDLYISVALTGSFSETGRVFEMPASSVMRRINNLEGWSEVAMYFPGIPPSATFKLAK